MIVMTVTGLYKENSSDQRNDFFRTFQKTLVIVPNNGGFCIRNELLHINNASPAQARNAFKSTIVSHQINSSFQSNTAPQPPQIDDTNQMKMIEMMSQQSNMNVEWSKKCLEETQWDFNRALYVFQELFKENKIPQEAFVK
jgi:nuclear RNA export factor